MHCSLRLIVQPYISISVQIQQPYASDEEAKVPECYCPYNFGFDNRVLKDNELSASHRFAVTNDMLHSFSLLSAESADRITLKQAHVFWVKTRVD
jgi:hypothetical protein